VDNDNSRSVDHPTYILGLTDDPLLRQKGGVPLALCIVSVKQREVPFYRDIPRLTPRSCPPSLPDSFHSFLVVVSILHMARGQGFRGNLGSNGW
jgi:hypothetical protein